MEFSRENRCQETGTVPKLFSGYGLRHIWRLGPILTRFPACPYSAELFCMSHLPVLSFLPSLQQRRRHASWPDCTDAVSGGDSCRHGRGCARSGD